MSFTYQHPRPALTVDALVFRQNGPTTEILLIQRKNPPFKGKWALPGGFVDMDETLEQAIARELEEETGITNLDLKQFHAFSQPGRDPRGHTISVVFSGILEDEQEAKAGDDAENAAWFETGQLPALAFDHTLVVERALQQQTKH